MLTAVVTGNTFDFYIWSAGVIGISFLIALTTSLIFKSLVKRSQNHPSFWIDDLVLQAMRLPIVLIIINAGIFYGLQLILLKPKVFDFVNKAYHIGMILLLTWLVVRLLKAFIDRYIKKLILNSGSDYNQQLMPVIKQLVFVAVWSIGIIISLNYAGYNVSALIAGLGIGGLAFALAAKDYIENIFGGMSVFTDKPFQAKDRIRVDGFDGTVEEVGIRRSRIRTLDGTLVTIPNAKFINNSIENVALELSRKTVLKLGLTYGTSSKKIEEALDILKEINADFSEQVTDAPVAFFSGFGDSALQITFVYYIKKEANIAETQNNINLEILKRFENANLEFAFPTQTIHMATKEN